MRIVGRQVGIKQWNGFHGGTNASEINGESVPERKIGSTYSENV